MLTEGEMDGGLSLQQRVVEATIQSNVAVCIQFALFDVRPSTTSGVAREMSRLRTVAWK